MNVDMDSIVISIESTTERASNAIDSLISKLNELQTALSNVGKSSKSFSKIKDSIPKVSSKTPSVSNKSNAKEQLDSLKPDLKGFDVVSVFSSQDTKGVTTEITKYKNKLGDVVTVQKKMKDGMDDYYRVTKKTTTDGVSAFDKFKNSVAGTVAKITAVVATAKNLAKNFSELVETSAEYTEAVNLFYTEMGDKAQEAEKFVKRFSDALYLDQADVMNYMGSFNSLVSGLGVGADNSYKMSKNLTQLAYDLASYKNLSVESAFDKLQSGIAGQIKGLRQVGVALSQNTLQELANELGIQQRVQTMDEASKAQLRYIQIMRSSTNWQGDLGKTMMSTENILRSARQQWTLMVRALGDVAAVIARVVMPYFIALTQIVKEAAVALARFFGLDIDFSDRFKDGGKSASVGLGKIEDGIGGVGSAAKKAKKDINSMLAPFDDLNVVQTKIENAGAGAGGGTGGGASLGDLPLPEYDALSKLTSEWSDKIANARKKIEALIPVAKKLLIALGAIWAIGKIAKFIRNLQTLGSVFKLLKTPTGTFGNLLKILGTRFMDGYKYAQALGGKGLGAILSGTRNLLGPLGKLGVTIGGTIASFATGYTEMKKYAKGNEDLGKALAITTGVTVAFGAAAFALVGWPAALIVGIGGLTGALAGYAQGLQEVKIHNEVFNGQGVKIRDLSDNLASTFENTSNKISKYSDTLKGLSDEYISAQSDVDSTRKSIDDFTASLDLQDGKVSSSQLGELKSKYQLLKEETNLAQKASNDYYIALIKANGEAIGSSNERTSIEIANYKKVASVAQGYVDEYIKKEEELNLKYYSGKMSAEDYRTAIENLKLEYGYAKSTTMDTAKAIDVFNNELKEIDYSSIEDTDNAIKTAKTSMDEQIKTLKEYQNNVVTANEKANKGYNEQIKNLEYAKKYGTEWTKGQEEHLQSLYRLVSENDTKTQQAVGNADVAIRNIQGSYKGYIEGIYADLVSKGADSSSEFNGTIKTIKSDIESLNTVNASGAGKSIKDTLIQGVIKNKPEMISKVSQALSAVGSDGGDALDSALRKQIDNNMPNLSKGIKDKFTPLGKASIDGMKKGVEDNKKSISSTGENIGKNLEDGTRKKLGINSPSKVYETLGKYVIDGFVKGLNDDKPKLLNAMNDILKQLNETSNKALKNIKFEINVNTFQSSLNKLLGKLQTFSNKFRSGVNSLLSTFTTSMNGIKVGSDNKIYYTKMPNISIPRFDGGGYPERASLFWANENGIPEMVGQIGNRTAVANNDQITTSITNALITALSGMNFGSQGTTVVNIGNKKVYEGMGEYLDGESERYGTAYVNI